MVKRIAGKIFSTPEEAGITPPTEDEIARARELFDDFQEKIDRVPDEERWPDVPKKFRDDTSGTEYEGWQDK